MADTSKWPHVPQSNLVDPTPNWRQVPEWLNWPIGKIRQVSVDSLRQLTTLNLFDFLDEPTLETIRNIVNGLPVQGEELNLITPTKLTSLMDANIQAETARAAIDVCGLLNLAAAAIMTGDLCGTQLTARDKIDLLKFLANKALPDAKHVEQREVADRVDRGRRKVSDMTEKEINALTREELLDQHARELAELAKKEATHAN